MPDRQCVTLYILFVLTLAVLQPFNFTNEETKALRGEVTWQKQNLDPCLCYL